MKQTFNSLTLPIAAAVLAMAGLQEQAGIHLGVT
jgi:hypothetical protein